MSNSDFKLLKEKVSKWFDRRNSLTMLKVLFKDHVDNVKLTKITGTKELLNELDDSKEWSSKDLTLLYDTIKITKQFGLENEISKYIKSYPDVKKIDISTFNDHRQKIMKFGTVLTEGDVTMIDGFFNMPFMSYGDSWSMITDLEKQLIISDEGDIMADFIDSMKELNLPLAVKALTEGSSRKRPNATESQDLPSEPKDKIRRVETETIPTSDIGDTPLVTPGASSATASPKPKDTPHEEPYIMPKLSQDNFYQLLVNVSSWWKKFGSINMLKVILSEFKDISVAQIEQKNQPIALFRLLLGPGHITPGDITVLVEAAVLGGQRGVEEKIKEMIPTFPGLSKIVISRFSKQRQNLIKFGTVIDKENTDAIAFLFDLNQQADQWCLIFQLEKYRKLTDDPKVKESFIKRLKDNDMIGEAEALNTF